jgi:hypothetical protein
VAIAVLAALLGLFVLLPRRHLDPERPIGPPNDLRRTPPTSRRRHLTLLPTALSMAGSRPVF